MYAPGMFKAKKVTVMGLGLLGRGVGDIAFLAGEGAELIVTDKKTETELQESLNELEKMLGKELFEKITFVLGEHRLEDFKNRDFILKAAGVPLDSPFIEEARKNNIPIEMSTALFVALTPATVIGITGTKGKSTVTQLVYEILKENYKSTHVKIFLGGNVRGVSTLQFLPQTKKGDIAVLELDSWQLQGFGERKISPHIALFTNFLDDHLNYYKNDRDAYLHDKAQIFLHQKQNDYLIAGPTVAHLITAKYFGKTHHAPISVSGDIIPADWIVQIKGEHNRDNIALAIKAATTIGVSYEVIKKVVEAFRGVAGRMELIREYKGIKIYNDTNATTPDATIAALRALNKNVVLIMGGADKTLDMNELLKEIPLHVKKVILLAGTGSDKIAPLLPNALHADSLEEAVSKGLEAATTGDSLLLSPAFASFGMFKNEYDRGEQFTTLVQSLS